MIKNALLLRDPRLIFSFYLDLINQTNKQEHTATTFTHQHERQRLWPIVTRVYGYYTHTSHCW